MRGWEGRRWGGHRETERWRKKGEEWREDNERGRAGGTKGGRDDNGREREVMGSEKVTGEREGGREGRRV